MNIYDKRERQIKCENKYHTMYGDGDELEIGKVYTLVGIDRYPFNTDVHLKEIPGKTFNSVFFEELDY